MALVNEPKIKGNAGERVNRKPAIMLAKKSPIPVIVCEKPKAVAFEPWGARSDINAFSTPSVKA